MKALYTLILAAGLLSSPFAAACEKHAPRGGEPTDKMAQWQGCEYVTDCTLVQTSCVGPVVINKQHVTPYLEWVRKNEPVVQCVRYFSPRQVTISCEEKRCQIKDWQE